MRNNLEGIVAGYKTNSTYSDIFAQEKILNTKSGRNLVLPIPFPPLCSSQNQIGIPVVHVEGFQRAKYTPLF